MNENRTADAVREPVLSVVDRVSEMLFGLFMALTFVGAVSVADAGREQLREMFVAALGCNLAWGLVDAVMYLVRTLSERAKTFTLVQSVRSAADPEQGRRLIEQSLSRGVARLFAPAELEAIRGRILSLTDLPDRPALKRDDFLAALCDIPDRGRVDFSRGAAFRVHRRRSNGDDRVARNRPDHAVRGRVRAGPLRGVRQLEGRV